MASHIVLNELGVPFEVARVDLRDKKVEGQDFSSFNPKGYVPALRLDNGELLTEGAAILQYLADQKPELKLAPAWGTMERYRLQEWLNYIATEVHKNFSPLWRKDSSAEVRQAAIDVLKKRFDFLTATLSKNTFLLGAQFTVADAYLFTVLNWCHYVKLDLSPWAVLQKYVNEISARPSVVATLKAEGLLKAA
jgi:glutathione S-transferase